MTLEELIGREETKKLAGKPFGINPSMDYSTEDDRKEFVSRAGDLFDLEEYYGKLVKNSSDFSALKDLVGKVGGYIEGDNDYKRGWIERAKENPTHALERGDIYLSEGYLSMAKFVEKNRAQILEKLSAEQLYALFARVPLYETGDKEHDRAKNLRTMVMQIIKAEREGGDIGSIINAELNELRDKMPDENKIYVHQDAHLAVPGLGRAIVRAIFKSYNKLFKDKDGKLNKEALIRYLERNYKVMEDEMSRFKEEKDKFKCWDKNLKPQYREIARELYKSEEPAQKKEDEPEREKEIDRLRNIGGDI